MLRTLAGWTVVLGLALSAARAETPRCTIPLMPTPPTIDGEILPGEWDLAGPLGAFHIVRTYKATPVRQQAWIGYDSDALYVAFRTYGENPTQLVSHGAKRDGAIWTDDAFEVFLWASGDIQNVIQFIGNCGGNLYDSKGGKTEWNAEWRYRATKTPDGWLAEMAVGWKDLGLVPPRAGDVWRFNVCHDDADLKESYVASWGRTRLAFDDASSFGEARFAGPAPAADVVNAEVSGDQPVVTVRVVNPGDARLALTSVLAFEGATPFEQTLTAEPRAASEVVMRPPVRVAKEATALWTVTAPDGTVIVTRTVPLAERAQASLGLRNLMPAGFLEVIAAGPSGAPAVLRYVVTDAAGAQKLSGAFEMPQGAVTERIATDALPDGAYRVTLAVRVPSMNLTKEETFDVEKSGAPAWLGTKAGLSDQPLPPYTPVRREGDSLLCWGRVYEFKDRFLPSRVHSQGRDVLAGPMRLIAEARGRAEDLAVLPPRATRERANRIESAARGTRLGLRITADSWMEEDGFWWVTVRIEPGRTRALDRLVLELPVRRDVAQYLHTAGSTQHNFAGVLPASGWQGTFAPMVSLLNDDLGITWSCETMRQWHPATEHVLRVDVSPDAAVLRCEIIGQPADLQGGLTYSFGVQAFPAKPIPADWRSRRICHSAYYGMEKAPAQGGPSRLDQLAVDGVRTLVYHDTWTPDFGKPYTEKREELRSLVAACHARGIKLLLYLGYGLGDLCPETKLYHDYWISQPLIRWTPGDGNARRAFSSTCLRPALWTDFILYYIERTISEFGFDGLYYDGTISPGVCRNEHHGCGYRDAHGELQGEYPLVAARAFSKRLYAVVKTHSPDGLIDGHTSGRVYPAEAAWVDQLWNGEQFECRQPGFHFPLDYFRAQCVGKQYGAPSEFLVYVKRPFELPEALSFTLLHDVLVRPNVRTFLPEMTRIWKIQDDFGVGEAQWLPYWDNAAHLRVTSDPAGAAWDEGGLGSLYLRPGKGALLVLSNIQTAPATVEAQLFLKQMGLTDAVTARDAETGQAIPVVNGRITLPLKGYEYKLIRVE